MLQADGKTGWRYAEFSIPTGTHTYKWIYQKDFMSEDGSDCVWVDDIIFPCSSFTIVEETIDENVVIYPNPTKDFINIKVKDFSVETIEIYNNAGVKVLETDFMNRLDISHLSPGLYIVNLIYKNKNHIKKMVIE